MKSFLYIEPYVYVNMNEKKGLLLNTFNHLLYVTSDVQILSILRNLTNSERGNLILYNKSLTKEIRQFIDWLKASYSGDFLTISDSQELPYQLLPNIENFSFKEMKENKICDVTFYLNSSCSQGCESCNLYNKQTIFCKNNNSKKLSLQNISSFLEEIGPHRINRISFIGGDIFDDSLKDYVALLRNIKCEKNIYIHITQITTDSIQLLNQCGSDITILVPDQYDLDTLIEKINRLSSLRCKYVINKIIKDEESLEIVYNQIPNINYIPFFNQNIKFFKKYVFMDIEDLKSIKTNMQELFNNNNFNSLFMGKIIVDSDLHVYVSFAEKSIGDIKTLESIRTLLNKLYDDNSLWKMTRKSVSPCNTCIFNLICPPLSNYELIMKRNNLCNLLDSVS